jgi:hypothetical protein
MEGETYIPLTPEEMTERINIPKYLMLDSIQVSRESIGVFTKIVSSMPPLEEQARELIYAEQDNIRKQFNDLKEWYSEQE